jgi:DNA-binding NtrC family response regulator
MKHAVNGDTMSGHVLIVDDDANFRYRTELALKKKGYRVSLADSGTSAMEMIMAAGRKGPSLNLIVLDMGIAAVTGFEMLLKLNENMIRIPVLAVSEYFNAEAYHRLLQLGCLEILFKPVRERMLVDIIQKHLAARHEQEARHKQ